MEKHEHYDEADLPAVKKIVVALAGMREDEGLFSARQLDYVKTRTYDKKLPPMVGLTLVPISTEVPEWAETFTYFMYDEVGMAKIVANYADDLPRADVKGEEKVAQIKNIGDSYGYSVMELRAAAANRSDLPTRKSMAARKAIEIKLNQMALIGDRKFGLYGLVNHPNVPLVVGLHGDWLNPATTPDQILVDLDMIYDAVTNQSKDVHTPTRIVMPTEQRSRIFSRRVPDSNGKTAGQFFLDKHPGLQIIGAAEFKGAGANGKDLILAYEYSEENLAMELPMPFNQLAAQARGLELVVPCLARAGGVVVYYPLSMAKGDI